MCGGASFREECLTLAERRKMDVLKINDDDDDDDSPVTTFIFIIFILLLYHLGSRLEPHDLGHHLR